MDLKVNDLRVSFEYGRGFEIRAHIEGDVDRNAIDELLSSVKDGYARMTVKKWYGRRSLTANAYAWVLIDKIAQAMRISKTDVYRFQMVDLGGNTDTVCIPDEAVERFRRSWEAKGLGWMTDVEQSFPGTTNVTVYYGSSSFDSETMSRFIENLVADAKELGIETLPPHELERMLSTWNPARSAEDTQS